MTNEIKKIDELRSMTIDQLIGYAEYEFAISDIDLPEMDRDENGDIADTAKNKIKMLDRIGESADMIGKSISNPAILPTLEEQKETPLKKLVKKWVVKLRKTNMNGNTKKALKLSLQGDPEADMVFNIICNQASGFGQK